MIYVRIVHESYIEATQPETDVIMYHCDNESIIEKKILLFSIGFLFFTTCIYPIYIHIYTIVNKYINVLNITHCIASLSKSSLTVDLLYHFSGVKKSSSSSNALF